MKHVVKKVLKIVGWILGILFLLLIISGIVNAIMLNHESKSLRGAYGKSVPIDGGNVHVDIQGNGKKVVVLLPGLGVAAPALDFKPLINNLKRDYTVVTYEGFGYGLSDDTTKPRTADNIVSEIHQTLAKLGYTKYSIVAHSVSGVYALKYSLKYTNEVEAVVGIDSTVPDQWDYIPEALKSQQPDIRLLTKLVRICGFFGIIRDYVSMDSNLTTTFDKTGYSFTSREKNLINKLTIRNFASDAVLDENNRTNDHIENLTATSKYPSGLPVKIFLARDTIEENPSWEPLHVGQIEKPSAISVVVLEGDHFLYHTQSTTIADGLRSLVAPTE